MTTQEILTLFHTITDDQSELSTQEEVDLAQNVYQGIYRNRHWYWLKKNTTGTLAVDSNGVSYITKPTDFMAFCINSQSTDNTMEVENNASPRVIYLIDASGNYIPYQIVNWDDRRMYGKNKGVCWLNNSNGHIEFSGTPNLTNYDFDYIGKPATLTLTTSPVFDSDFHNIIAYGMKLLNYGIQLFDRTHSYAKEDTMQFDKTFLDLCYDNAQQQQN